MQIDFTSDSRICTAASSELDHGKYHLHLSQSPSPSRLNSASPQTPRCQTQTSLSIFSGEISASLTILFSTRSQRQRIMDSLTCCHCTSSVLSNWRSKASFQTAILGVRTARPEVRSVASGELAPIVFHSWLNVSGI